MARFFTALFLLILLLVGFIEIGKPSHCGSCHEMKPAAYSHAKSNHANVSCLSCHYNTGILASIGLGRLNVFKCYISHLTGNYSKPINESGKLYEKIKSDPCLKCHPLEKEFTPRRGILINHKKHFEKGISCTTCHNRVSHNLNLTVQEIIKLGLGTNIQITDRMKMQACMECHTGKKGEAPSACSACHPQQFKLPYSCASCHENLSEITPRDHFQPNYEKKPHADAARGNLTYCLQCHRPEDCESCHLKNKIALKLPKITKSEYHKPASHFEKNFVRAIHGKEAMDRGKDYCFQCHQPEFCDTCHKGIEMPHTEEFKAEHGQVALSTGFENTCINCHPNKNQFCESGCHHKGWNPKLGPLDKSHPQVVKINGVSYCLTCHTSVFCAVCHTTGEKKYMFRSKR